MSAGFRIDAVVPSPLLPSFAHARLVGAVAAILVAAGQLLAQTSSYPQIAVSRSELAIRPPIPLSPSERPGARQVSSVDVDGRGNVYVLQRGVEHPITVTAPDGRVLASFGEGLFRIAHGIRVDPQGNVWATESSTLSKVYKFTSRGQKLLEIDINSFKPLNPNTERWVPDVNQVGVSDVAFAANGHIYVSDGYMNARVIQLDASGRFIREWGGPGRGPGEFRLPHGIAVAPDGNVYVADRENGRLQVFTPEGRFLKEHVFGGDLASIEFGPDGAIYAGNRAANAPAGSEGRTLKIDAVTGRVIGQFSSPTHFVAVGPDGTAFIGMQTGRVALFRPQ
jgi:DNA-binding beta-propeller fold protein YncE